MTLKEPFIFESLAVFKQISEADFDGKTKIYADPEFRAMFKAKTGISSAGRFADRWERSWVSHYPGRPELEESNLAYLSRQIAREKLKAEQYVTKRKEENATRIAQGLAPLPEENINRLFKIPPEPSRLESMLLLGQIDGFSKSLASASSSGLVTMYAAKASSEV